MRSLNQDADVVAENLAQNFVYLPGIAHENLLKTKGET
jgi:hypothetical protein